MGFSGPTWWLARLYAIAGEGAAIRECERRHRERGISVGTPVDLAFAFAEIGDEQHANQLELEQVKFLERAPGLSGRGLHLQGYWLTECDVYSLSIHALSDLPAFDQLQRAVERELDRRRSLYLD